MSKATLGFKAVAFEYKSSRGEPDPMSMGETPRFYERQRRHQTTVLHLREVVGAMGKVERADSYPHYGPPREVVFRDLPVDFCDNAVRNGLTLKITIEVEED